METLQFKYLITYNSFFWKAFLKKFYQRKYTYERNFKHFNEKEFEEALKICDWYSILSLHQNDPDLSMNNLYNNTIYLLDEFAPDRKHTQKRI